MDLRICHLYPDLMNIYGDRGNVLCLAKRCQWRGIKVAIEEISLGDKIDPRRFDLYFGGGGQDRQQIAVSHDLQGDKKKALKEATEMNVPMLAICGTYQLFGHYFKPFEGPRLLGIGIFDAYTVASKKRKIGNIVIQSSIINRAAGIASGDARHQSSINTLVGFENHSGNTYITKNKDQRPKTKTYPLSRVLVGFGNNGQDKTEGAVYKNAFGCYLHGSLLPKNPHFADYLIGLGLKRRYGEVELKPLDDNLEWQAHKFAIKRARQSR
jgi:CobQ-like glutamine amidotransferase family enzyme